MVKRRVRRLLAPLAEREVATAVRHGWKPAEAFQEAAEALSGSKRKPGEDLTDFMARALGMSRVQLERAIELCGKGYDIPEAEEMARSGQDGGGRGIRS